MTIAREMDAGASATKWRFFSQERLRVFALAVFALGAFNITGGLLTESTRVIVIGVANVVVGGVGAFLFGKGVL